MKMRFFSLLIVGALLFVTAGNVYAANANNVNQTEKGSIFSTVLEWLGLKQATSDSSGSERKEVKLGNQGKIISDPIPTEENIKSATNEPVVIERDTNAKVINEKGKVIGSQRFSKSKRIHKQATSATVVTAVIAADEEYRARYPDWKQRTLNIVEQADNAFYRDHQVDFHVAGFQEWNSNGYNSSRLLEDLDRDLNRGQVDFVIGFTNDRYFDAGGIAYLQPTGGPGGSAVSVTKDMHPNAIWHVVQHELSHNFGVPHDRHGRQYEKCIMNYYYTTKIDYWDEAHDQLIERNKFWYGNRQSNNPDKGNDGQTPQDVSAYEKAVVDLVNQERTSRGLKPLQIDGKLSKVARLKSEDMRDNNYFSHHSPKYGSPFDMMKKFGIQYSYAGENIAAGQPTPQEVMKSWMNSPGHRANILSSNYTHIGVGYVEGGSYRTYWTQQFIRK